MTNQTKPLNPDQRSLLENGTLTQLHSELSQIKLYEAHLLYTIEQIEQEWRGE
tara:strand:- start:224 stop:382 length:159 start_codon:yes stop_codon:yes gene_type:complete